MAKFTMNYREFFNEVYENDGDFASVENGIKGIIALLNTYDTLDENQRDRLKTAFMKYVDDDYDDDDEAELLELLDIDHC